MAAPGPATSTVHQATRCIAVDTTVSASESRADIMMMMTIIDARVADTMTMTTIGKEVENTMMMMMMTIGAKVADTTMTMMMITEEGVENMIPMNIEVANTMAAATTGAREASMITGAREESTMVMMTEEEIAILT